MPTTISLASLIIAAVLIWLIAVVANPWRDFMVDPPTVPTRVRRSAVVHVSILAPTRQVITFLVDVHNWVTWAPWIRSVTRSSERDWTLDTESGPLRVRFVEQNKLGVLDHEVTLPSGVRVLNSMRVLPNDSGSELVMVLFQSPEASSDQFERDLQAVRDDLARIKELSEAMASEDVVATSTSSVELRLSTAAECTDPSAAHASARSPDDSCRSRSLGCRRDALSFAAATRP